MAKPLSELTEQELFTKTIKHFYKQGRQAITADGDGYTYCVYRGKIDGKVVRCAAGCHLPNKDYDKKMEGLNIYGNRRVFTRAGYTDGQVDFLHRLQTIHDEAPSFKTMMKDYRDFAKESKLKFPTRPKAANKETKP